MKKGYKQTEVGVIPEDWDVIPFSKCFDTIKNNTLSRAELNYDSGKIRNIHYGDVLINFPSIVDCQKETIPFINEDATESAGNSFLQDGDIVIADTAEDNTVGKAVEVFNIGDSKVVAGLHTMPCRPKNKFAVKFLGYYINARVFHDQIIPYITGTKVSSISKKAIDDTTVLVPPFAEQKRIAEALSDVDELIASLEKLIEKKKAIKQGVMQELLTGKRRLPGFTGEWKEYRIGDMGDFYSGLSGKSKADFENGNSKYITFLNVLSNTVVDTSSLGTVSINNNEQQNQVKKGDLFFNTSSETPEEVGMCAVLNKSLENTYLNSFCFGFRLKDNKAHEPLFLSYYFNSFVGRKIMSVLAQGATRYNLSKSSFEDTIIRIPMKDEQIAISDVLSEQESEINQLVDKLSKIQLIKSGMMRGLLTGRIRLGRQL